MAKMNGCNSDMPSGSVGSKSTRMNPTSFARNNLSKGGVNDHQGGTDVVVKPSLKPGAASQGKHKNMPRGY